MALLKLQDIGKIYVSEGNVAVGIRGVSLSFDRGEFVAITGKSGSGKSTLLNVISGMDTYEEGELLIEGQSTSHYLQPEWEEYREKYISFIFQDYNIIESFTVLQNVELALMHIENAKQRRARAMELIKRVGLLSHVKQKGSQLSGGQKQRTVIARALAKDSPIILADEPTGNLDSATSKEIIALLKEVSKDKLLIVVTHNFDDFKDCATRHVRIFDGAIESDQVIEKPQPVIAEPTVSQKATSKSIKQIKNGFVLGKSIFLAKPKLSTFLCLLMVVGALGIFLITSLMASGIGVLFEKQYMFTHIDGRVVVTADDGAVLTEEEIAEVAAKYGAQSYIHYDSLLDNSLSFSFRNNRGYESYAYVYAGFAKDYSGGDILGRMPENADEVLLYLPLSYQKDFGDKVILNEQITIDNLQCLTYKVTGVKYFVDNNLQSKILFTDEGYEIATAVYSFSRYTNGYVTTVTLTQTESSAEDGFEDSNYMMSVATSFEVEEGKFFVNSDEYLAKKENNQNVNWQTSAQTIINGDNGTLIYDFGNEYFTETKPILNNRYSYLYKNALVASPYLLKPIAYDVLAQSYSQFSLFFESDAVAASVAENMMQEGYIAVPSNTVYEVDALLTIISTIAGLFMLGYWFGAVMFLAFFVNICSKRSIDSFKNDMNIMRSMGISVKAIRTAMHVRMLLALIPAFIAVIITAIFIFINPVANGVFTYLYWWHYLLMFAAMAFLTVFVTRRQIGRMFKQSVKKSLKGGGVA